jgi:predicted dinucleotide-binding enzyme
LAAAGHDIAVSFARTPDQVTLAAQAMGQAVRAETPETAVRDADVVILATPWGGDARHRQEALAIAYR